MNRRISSLDIAVFVAILLLGVARLPAPFSGDQALNMLMGRVIGEGGAPYVDLWDLKHPGIFFFFAAGGSLFGFSELGIHLFELLWMVTLALAVRVTAEGFLDSPLAVSLSPALTVGVYYGVATGLHLTQTEAVVGLPLLLSLASVVAAVRSPSRPSFSWLFASGLSAGAVLVFKAPYAALPAVFWVLAAVEWRRARGTGILQAARTLAPPLLGGMLLPVAASVVYLTAKDVLEVAWWTFVVHPREAASETALDLQRLRDGAAWFLRTFGAPLALAVVGGWDRLRRGWDLPTVAMVAWILVGLLLIWMQVIGWWSYHYLLLLVPLGLLAAQGVGTLWRATLTSTVQRYRRVVAAVALLGLTLAFIPRLEPGARSLTQVLRARPLPLGSVSARSYQAGRDSAYAEALDTTAFLRSRDSGRGAIFVFGSPILYVLAERPPAIAYLATWFHPTREATRRMVAELTAASPPYVLVTEGGLEFFTDENPDLGGEVRTLRSWLDRQYRRLRTDVGGTWYERADLVTPAETTG